MDSKPAVLQALLDDIRRCKDCDVACRNTPVVYSAARPKIMVVSEVPPDSAWAVDLGRKWESSLGVREYKQGTAYQLCEWLHIVDEADELLFWIQRANCSVVKKEKGYAALYCSAKFIPRAIQVVKPKLVITLGHSAARYFLDLKHLSEKIGESSIRKEGLVEYTLVPMLHPSNANQAARTAFKPQQDKAIGMAKTIIERIKCDTELE